MSGAKKKSTSHKESPARKQSIVIPAASINHTAQEKIKELEHQVSELKKRLDELRKAKCTTIIKKDKEYVTTGTPQLPVGISSAPPPRQDCVAHKDRIQLLESSLKESEMKRKNDAKIHQDEIARLWEKHGAEVEALRTAKQAQPSEDSELAAEVAKLRKQNKELLEENQQLKSTTTQLHLEIDDLTEMLSRKEAEWCSKEDKLKMELKIHWGEKYQRWMAQTEQKIEELQEANSYLAPA